MKVLFVCSGNKGRSPIVEAQYNSLDGCGVELDCFTIIGSGFLGYLLNVRKLQRKIFQFKPDLIHAHYSFCGVISVLATLQIPVVCSLMGSDVSSKFRRLIVVFFSSLFWSKVILKADSMRIGLINSPKYVVIPNGVDMSHFSPDIQHKLENLFDEDGYHLLFLADVNRPEKNYQLALDACRLLPKSLFTLHHVSRVKHSDVVNYILSSDVILLTSYREGSPNVVKEAMACNVPVVATRVGDIDYLFEGAVGYYTADFDPAKVAEKIMCAISQSSICNGRQIIKDKKLDSISVAQRIIELYKEVVNGI